MKFKLTVSSYFCDNVEEKIKLENIGFIYEKSSYRKYHVVNNHENKPIIEIKNLKQLIDFINKYGDIIISNNNYLEIEIYNGYRE